MTTPLTPVRAASVRLWRSHVDGITLDWGEDFAGIDSRAVDEVQEYVARPADIDAALLARVEALERERDALLAALRDIVPAAREVVGVDYEVDDDGKPCAGPWPVRVELSGAICGLANEMTSHGETIATALAPARTKGEDGADHKAEVEAEWAKRLADARDARRAPKDDTTGGSTDAR